jgi:phosphoribosylglycinamide formyltransferase-1
LSVVSDTLNIAVFASGRGSNFLAILQAIQQGRIRNANIVLVVSDKSDAGALDIARTHGIPAVHLDKKQFATEDEFVAAVLHVLEESSANFIVLAGYLKLINPEVIRRFRNRIVNIHPALLPQFGGKGMYGMKVHEAVIRSRAKTSGATVHIVDEQYDHGAIVLQRTVDVSEDETPESLSQKVLDIEHQLFPEAVRLFAEGRVKVNGSTVTILH